MGEWVKQQQEIDPSSSHINWAVNPLNSQLSAWKRNLGLSTISLQDQTVPLRASHQRLPEGQRKDSFLIKNQVLPGQVTTEIWVWSSFDTEDERSLQGILTPAHGATWHKRVVLPEIPFPVKKGKRKRGHLRNRTRNPAKPVSMHYHGSPKFLTRQIYYLPICSSGDIKRKKTFPSQGHQLLVVELRFNSNLIWEYYCYCPNMANCY